MKILLVGFGKVNRLIYELYEKNIVGIYDVNTKKIDDIPDVIIDFSHPDFLDQTILLVNQYKCPIVIGTTNYNNEKRAQIREISKIVPVLMSSNFSLGIYLLERMFKDNQKILDMYKKEIIETHHNHKNSSPSGTSMLLADLIDTENITSIRIGDVIGEHEIILERENEVLTINHTITNRKVYAVGAIKSAEWLLDKKPGLYSYGDIYE